MNRTALTIAVMAFFVLAIVAWAGGCTTFACAVRGLIGAAATYLIVRIAYKLLVRIIADAMVRSQLERDREGKERRA